jgi:membrane protein required for colicin V production
MEYSLNTLDILIALPLIWGIYRGFTKGFIIEAATLAGLILGVFVAYQFSDYTSEFLMDQFDFRSEYLPLIAFAITFIGVLILLHLFGRFLDKAVKSAGLGFFNRVLGAFLKLAGYVFILSILFSFINHADHKEKLITPSIKERSALYKPVSEFAPMIFPYLNLDGLFDFRHHLKESIREMTDAS